jgi:hypothetical protein
VLCVYGNLSTVCLIFGSCGFIRHSYYGQQVNRKAVRQIRELKTLHKKIYRKSKKQNIYAQYLISLNKEKIILKLGFIGIGKIASAVIKGLCTSDAENIIINLSPRNKLNSARLAKAFFK